jgi:hypothetical protein
MQQFAKKTEWEVREKKELESIAKNEAWANISVPTGSNVIPLKWVLLTKTRALSYQKSRKARFKNACGLMAKTKDTHTHASNDSYEHPPRSEFVLVVSSNALT